MKTPGPRYRGAQPLSELARYRSAVLVALGSLIGAGCASKPKQNDSWLIVPNLWGAVVGAPSTKQSPALDAGLRPLDRLIEDAHKAHDTARQEYEGQMLIHTARKDAVEGRIKQQAKTSGQSLAKIAQELGYLTAPETPKERRYKTNDTTVEKLGELLRDNPRGILAKRDELIGLIASWDREGREGERAFWLQAWNGNPHFDTDRVGRGHVRIENVCVSLIGGIEPGKLIAYLEEATNARANDGMVQRTQVLVYPDHRCGGWRDMSPNKEARDATYAVFEKLAGMNSVVLGAPPADDFAKFPYFRFGLTRKRYSSNGLPTCTGRGSSRKIDGRLYERILRRLDRLDAATTVKEMDVPGFDLHPLHGQPQRYSVHVNGPWCLRFECAGGDALRVDLEQYH